MQVQPSGPSLATGPLGLVQLGQMLNCAEMSIPLQSECQQSDLLQVQGT